MRLLDRQLLHSTSLTVVISTWVFVSLSAFGTNVLRLHCCKSVLASQFGLPDHFSL